MEPDEIAGLIFAQQGFLVVGFMGRVEIGSIIKEVPVCLSTDDTLAKLKSHVRVTQKSSPAEFSAQYHLMEDLELIPYDPRSVELLRMVAREPRISFWRVEAMD